MPFVVFCGYFLKDEASLTSDKTVVVGCMTQTAQLGRYMKNGVKGKSG